MKAITIHQPWASLIAHELKRIETRSWRTNYRGKLAIHASLTMPDMNSVKSINEALKRKCGATDLPYGKILAVADLIDCQKVIDRSMLNFAKFEAILESGQIVKDDEYSFGDYTPGRYAWILDNIQQIDPAAVRGRQGLWNWEGDEA